MLKLTLDRLCAVPLQKRLPLLPLQTRRDLLHQSLMASYPHPPKPSTVRTAKDNPPEKAKKAILIEQIYQQAIQSCLFLIL
jgi:hypothetical protein